MQPELIIRALGAMSEKTSIEQFCLDSGIRSRSVARAFIGSILSQGIGRLDSKGTISFAPKDVLEAAILAIQQGCDIERVSQYLSWKGFEKLAAGVLESLGYSTRTNLRFTKPRMELDVVGISASGLALAVDCKHWRRNNLSSIMQFCAKQQRRTEELVRRENKVACAVPVVMTLHAERVSYTSTGIPVVPVAKFHSFAMDVSGFLDDVLVIRRESALQ